MTGCSMRTIHWLVAFVISFGIATPMPPQAQSAANYTGTVIAATFAPNVIQSQEAVQTDTHALFVRRVGTVGMQLWSSDGTVAGTQALMSGVVGIYGLTVVGNRVFFIAYETISGSQLWVSDGTIAGTNKAFDLDAAIPGFGVSTIGTYANQVVLMRFSPAELWLSDGTVTGTKQLFASQEQQSYIRRIYPTQNRLYFLQDSLDGRQRLWVSGGVASDAVLLKEAASPRVITPITETLGDTLFFQFQSTGITFELWATAGTPATTRSLLSDFVDGVIRGNGEVLFAARAPGAVNKQIWRSDGTTEGTVPISEPLANNRNIVGLPALADDQIVFLTANLAFEDARLFGVDRATGALQLLRALNGFPTKDDGKSSYFSLLANNVFFITNDSGTVITWRSDGTVAGTYSIMQSRGGIGIITYSDPILMQRSIPGFYGIEYELAVSDGTATGVRTIQPYYGAERLKTFVVNKRLVVLVISDTGDRVEVAGANAASHIAIPSPVEMPQGGVGRIPIQYATNGSAATGVTVSLTLPAGVSYIGDDSGITPVINGATLTWNMPDLAAWQARILKVRVQMPADPLGTQYQLNASMATTSVGANPAQISNPASIVNVAQVMLPMLQN
jgi:ELWxxDGT repeat protein